MSRLYFLILFHLVVLAAPAADGGPFQVKDPVSGIFLVDGTTAVVPKENTRAVGSVLAFFLGSFGAHRLYLGTDVKVAVIYGITFGGFGVLPLLDLGHLLFTKDLSPYRNNNRVFMWSQAPTPP